jgi:hypothetical protein
MIKLFSFLMIFSFAVCQAQEVIKGVSEKPWYLCSQGCSGEVFSKNATRDGLIKSGCFQICMNGSAIASVKSFTLIVNQDKYVSESCSLTAEMKIAIKNSHTGQKITFTNLVIVGSTVCPRQLPDRTITIVN